MRTLCVVFFLSLVMAIGCTTVPPRITMNPTAPIDPAKEFFVSANIQQDEIVKALHSAGVKTTNRSFLAGYQIDVRVGRARRTFDCGTLNSVHYTVEQDGKKLMEIRGRGRTGNCKPNIFDHITAMILEQSA